MSTKNDLKYPKPLNYETQCKAIHESCTKLTLTAMIQVLQTRTTAVERREMKETYKKMYGENLLSDLHKLKLKLNSNSTSNSKACCNAYYLWMCESYERDAILGKETLEKNVVDYIVLVEMFVGRKSSHVLMIKQDYQFKVKRNLEQDIVTLEPPHPFQRILVAISTSHKALAHLEDVRQDIAKSDAMRLYQTGEASCGSINEAVILELLCKRSISQLKLTFSSYMAIYGHSVTKHLKKVHSTQFEDAIRNVVECIQDPPNYYAKMLHRSMKGGEIGQGSLTRVIVSRAEIDMGEKQRVYKKKYGVELKDTICKTLPSGDYRDFILSLTQNA